MPRIHSKMEFDGLDLTVEVPAGGTRTGVNRAGERWENKVSAHYGYILGTHSPDGEHLDFWLKSKPSKNKSVYVMHQLSVDGAKYDEDKVMLGYSSAADAIADFKKHLFKPGKMYGGYSEFQMEHFKAIAYAASNSSVMLASQAMYDKFTDKGLLPKGIRSPIQLSKILKESAMTADFDNMPLIQYEDPQAAQAAFSVAQDLGLDIHFKGLELFFATSDELESFIDAVDHNQEDRALLGNLSAALPESLDELNESNMGDAIEDLARELGSSRDGFPEAHAIAQEYGLDVNALVKAFQNKHGPMNEWPTKRDEREQFKQKSAAADAAVAHKAVADKTAQRVAKAAATGKANQEVLTKMAARLNDEIGNSFPDGDPVDAVEKVLDRFGAPSEHADWERRMRMREKLTAFFLKTHANGADSLYDYYDQLSADMGGSYHYESVESHNNLLAEMRKLAGVRDNNIQYQGTPIVSETRSVVISLQEQTRRALKKFYLREALRTQAAPQLAANANALAVLVNTASRNPQAATSAVARKVAETLQVNLSEGIHMTPESFVHSFQRAGLDRVNTQHMQRIIEHTVSLWQTGQYTTYEAALAQAQQEVQA